MIHLPRKEQPRVGEAIQLEDGLEGLVVCSIDRGEFSTDFPASDWAYLGCGILVQTVEAGLIHWIENPGPWTDAKLTPRE
jgi:hypothetical protein